MTKLRKRALYFYLPSPWKRIFSQWEFYLKYWLPVVKFKLGKILKNAKWKRQNLLLVPRYVQHSNEVFQQTSSTALENDFRTTSRNVVHSDEICSLKMGNLSGLRNNFSFDKHLNQQSTFCSGAKCLHNPQKKNWLDFGNFPFFWHF